MTVIVGFLPEQQGKSALQLGAQFAASLGCSLTAVTVLPTLWTNPSPARVDAEFAEYIDHFADEAAAAGKAYLDEIAPDLPATFERAHHRSVSAALEVAATEHSAEALVLGSAGDGALGTINVGSTADRLLHSSPVPLALAPRGYRTRETYFTRATCAFPGAESDEVIARARHICDRIEAPLRVVTFAVRGGAMYPPVVGLRTEDEVTATWVEQSRQRQDRLRAEGVIDDDTTTEVAVGRGWREAIDDLDWSDGEVLLVGSSPAGILTRVFLGSNATKLIRHSPVPAIVLPR